MIRKTKRQILIETIDSYSNPWHRSTFGSHGKEKDKIGIYCDERGNRCAVGRCMTKSALDVFGDSSKRVKFLAENGNLDHLLDEQYRGHDLDFWGKLQNLHDESSYWSEDGITTVGLNFIQECFDIDVFG